MSLRKLQFPIAFAAINSARTISAAQVAASESAADSYRRVNDTQLTIPACRAPFTAKPHSHLFIASEQGNNHATPDPDAGNAQVLLKAIGDAIISTDIDGNIVYMNPVAERLTGWSLTDAISINYSVVLRIIDADLRTAVPSTMMEAMRLDQVVCLPRNCLLLRRDGVETAIEDSTAPIHGGGGHITGAVMVFHDVSLARAHTQQLAHLAQHDRLTDLPNNILFNDRLSQAMALARRHRQQLAVLFIDLDHFKTINDSLGHASGDQLLQSVAARLLSCVRATDTASRRGGDEFVILLSEIAHAEDAAICAEKLLRALNAAHDIDGRIVNITASIGIATFPEDGTELEPLLRNADAAMYRAKDSGRSNYKFFNAALPLAESKGSKWQKGINRTSPNHRTAP